MTVSRPAIQPSGRSVSQSVSQSVGNSLGRPAIHFSRRVDQPTAHSVIHSGIRPAINQPNQLSRPNQTNQPHQIQCVQPSVRYVSRRVRKSASTPTQASRNQSIRHSAFQIARQSSRRPGGPSAIQSDSERPRQPVNQPGIQLAKQSVSQ